MNKVSLKLEDKLPTKRIIWFKQFLINNDFAEKLKSYINSQAKSEKSTIMAEELVSWFELNETVVISKVAVMLSMICETYMKAQHVLPVLQWIEFEETFGEGQTPRYVQFVNFVLSTLHQQKWMATNDSKGIVSHIDCPEIVESYQPAPTDWWIETEVTGNFLSKSGSHNLDHNNEALACYSSVPLKVTDAWFEEPMYAEPQRADCNDDEEYKNKLKVYDEYISKLSPAVTETAMLDKPIYLPHILDKRYRAYVIVDCLNIHQIKQARTILELYNKEKVVDFEIPATEVDVDIPSL